MLHVLLYDQNTIKFYALFFSSLFCNYQIRTERFHALTVTEVLADKSVYCPKYVMQVNQSLYGTNRAPNYQWTGNVHQSKALRSK